MKTRYRNIIAQRRISSSEDHCSDIFGIQQETICSQKCTLLKFGISLLNDDSTILDVNIFLYQRRVVSFRMEYELGEMTWFEVSVVHLAFS